jgi:class 3 adenylate cyclase
MFAGLAWPLMGATILGMVVPTTRWAKSGAVNIAYQVIGSGAFDLVYVPGFCSDVELAWEWPPLARFYRALASFSRLIVFDRRGTGMSDPVSEQVIPSPEARMDDIRAVLDATGSEQAALMGVSEAAPLCALFAATHPERTRALICWSGFPRYAATEGFEIGLPPEELEEFSSAIAEFWGTDAFGDQAAAALAPTSAEDPAFRAWFRRYLRRGAAPGSAVLIDAMANELDVRHVLPSIHVPTLVMHRIEDENRRLSRYLAEHIPKARLVELPGCDHLPWSGDADAVIGEVEQFLTGSRTAPDRDRVLATVLFTDLVASTERAAELGDRRWTVKLQAHQAVVRRELARFGGREIDNAGDGFLATFDGPARAIRCAAEIVTDIEEQGLQVRAGLHTGECELVDGAVRGIAVHTGARVMALAQPGEVLISSTVKDLVAGSGLEFDDRGEHALKGVPGKWRLYALHGLQA